MNQQNQGSGVPSNFPMKRKRGRPRKEENVVHGGHKSDNVLNYNQTTGTTNGSDSGMLGKMVTGVIEASFNDGYLVNVKVAESDSFLRGVVFLPSQVIPVTAENDVAPHVQMIKRKEFPIPMLNPQTNEVHGSLLSFQSFEPQIPPAEHVLPIEINSGISVPPIMSVAEEHVNQSSSLKSEMDCDKTIEQVDKLHELDASMQVEESNADGGAAKESKPASETMNPDKEIRNEQQVFPSVHQMNEVVHDNQNNSNIKLNLVPVSAESIPSEPASKSVEKFVEKQNLPETDSQDVKTNFLSIEILNKFDNTSNSNGKPSTGIATDILDVVPNHAVETNQHESIQSEQVDQSDPSDNKLSSEGHDFMEKSDPQNFTSLGDVNKVDFNHPSESLVDAVPYENHIGSST